MRNIIISEVKYDVSISKESNAIQAASVIGYFDYPVICMGEYYEDKTEYNFTARKDKKVKTIRAYVNGKYRTLRPATKNDPKENILKLYAPTATLTADDILKRYCKECGSIVHPFEPEVTKDQVHYFDFVKGHYYPKCHAITLKKTRKNRKIKLSAKEAAITPTYKEHSVGGFKCTCCGGIFAENEVSVHPTIDQVIIREKFNEAKENDHRLERLDTMIDRGVFTEDETLYILNSRHAKDNPWNSGVEMDVDSAKDSWHTHINRLGGKLKDSVRKSINADKAWYEKYANVLNAIYSENADDASKDFEMEKCVVKEEMIGVNSDGDRINDDGSLNNSVEYSKDSTELSKELLNFWGYPKAKGAAGGKSVIWTAIRYSRDAAIKKVLAVKDQLSEGDLEWLREILGDKNIRISDTIRNLLPIREFKSNSSFIKSHTKYMNSPEWAALYAALLGETPTEPTPPKGNKPENVTNKEPVEQKYLIIDFYKSVENCKEGTIISFEYINGKFGKKAARPVFSNVNCATANKNALKTIDNMKKNYEFMGFKVIVRDMDRLCFKEHNKTASRIAMRKLWSDIENYAKMVKSTKYACLV